ncbi:hypothetical protein HanHA300_Chr03g0073351 [Helianthus annuus]|nr:hypothetical protein HanHA300_Chr03g0073351 [Helianthus annuus]KAJ0740049.1 hypothetical protein HanOQP8_Chr06g0212571 [Helianthus annuus]
MRKSEHPRTVARTTEDVHRITSHGFAPLPVTASPLLIRSQGFRRHHNRTKSEVLLQIHLNLK